MPIEPSKTRAIIPLLLLVISVGIIEFLVMQFLPWFEIRFPSIPEAALDAILLSISIAPLVYFIIRKDLNSHQSTDKNIRNQLMLASGLPLVIALGLMFNILASKQDQISELETAKKTITLDIILSDFVDKYGEEIELSALSLMGDKRAEAKLSQVRKTNDKLRSDLKTLVVAEGVNVGNFDDKFFSSFVNSLNILRTGTDNRSHTWNFYTSFFMQSNEQFLRRLTTFSNQLGSEEIENRHVNYLSLIKIKTINNLIKTTMNVSIALEASGNNFIDIKGVKQNIRFKHAQNITYSDMFLSSTLSQDQAIISDYSNHDFHKEIASFQQLLEERKVETLIAELRGFIGYNGLIHQFKNYVLRGDEKYKRKFRELYLEVNQVLLELSSLIYYHDDALSYLLNLKSVLEAYNNALDEVKRYHALNYTSGDIDQLVQIDDSPAQDALNYLQGSLWESNPTKALNFYQQKTDALKVIDEYLGNRLTDSHTALLMQKQQESYLTAAIALLLGISVVALLIVISRNISLSYQERIEALIKAEEAAKLKSEFLANMSHEIRTPMNGVLGMLSLLANSELSDEQAHRVDVAKSSGESLLTLINDILDFSKVEAGKLDLEMIDFNVRRLFGDIAESMALPAQEKGLEIILDLREIEQTMIKTDPGRLRQIMTNIIGNAIKFTEQGEIIISAKLMRHSSDDNLILQCQIKDSGIGIPDDKIAQLFGAFNQVDASTTRKYGGTGLGLTITKKLCQLMGGDIQATSKVGQGSCFSFDVTVEKSQQSVPVLPNYDISSLHILIVDDNQTNIEVVKGQLEEWGATVTEALSGVQALELCSNRITESEKSLFDIALLDMQMPEMDGEELATKIRRNTQYDPMKLIMMTSMGERGDAARYADIGFNGYFPKPTTTKNLFYALSIVAEGGVTLEQAKPLVTSHFINSALTEETAKQKPKRWNKNTRILLVEDNRVNQMVALGVLKDLNVTADVAANGIEAIDSLVNSLSVMPYSLILMDCQMPEMDGYEATKRIRLGDAGEANKTIPIVAMTANAMQGDREKCLSAGMDDYLTKPIASDKISNALSTWLKETATAESDSSPTIKKVDVTLPKQVEVTPTQETESIVTWDEAALVRRVNDNLARAAMLINIYLSEAPIKIAELKEAMTQNDVETFNYCLSNIHSMAGNISGEQLFSYTKNMLTLSKENNHDEILERLPTFFNLADDLQLALSNGLKNYPSK